MADKLKWLNQHFVLLKNELVMDVVLNDNYKIPFELQKTAELNPRSEEFIARMLEQKQYKEFCTFLGHNMHVRAVVWWGYCIVLSLQKELEEAPYEERDIADIGKPKPFDIPDWAKTPDWVDSQSQTPPIPDDAKKKIDELIQACNKAKQDADAFLATVPKEILDEFAEIEEIVLSSFKSKFGMTPDEFAAKTVNEVKQLLENPPKFVDKNNSPIFKAENDLKEKLESIRQETIEKVKMAVPKKHPEEMKMQKSNAMSAAYSYIAAPNDENAAICMEVGNACPDQPEGMLALTAFWSYGNLTPFEKMVVKTPPGLLANGITSLINMCALARGGTRKYKERLEHYADIGLEVVFGQNNWSKHLEHWDAPHEMTNFEGAFTGSMKAHEAEQEMPKQHKSHAKPFIRFKG